MRAGLKDTLFPDDPFRGLGGMPHAQRAWRVASYFVPALDWGAGYSAASFWYDLLADVHRFVLPAAVGVRGDGELEEPRGGAGGHVIIGGKAGDPDGFHVTAGDHRVHGRHGGRDHAATAQGHPRHDALTTKKVSAFVVGAITLIVAPFAVPSASFTRDIGRAVAECAERDGGHGRGEAKAAREAGDRRGGSEDAEVEEEEEREHREGGAARRGGERGEKCARERERGGERQGDDVATLTCGAHVGPMLTQLSRRTKQGSKPPKYPK
uniref:Uncharacterized protein n=1 Tax=Oryza barthii TaxID=65489 RepID=A0A0D3GEC9_9ORYZ